ncbi:GNAT family N-acetyltransferase [Hymenobacter wooponensis]|uniref:GNAT family N-acetyltransferase n=1 Tax=Hymenobacter wooponensis TaxID=1525360 RepID=A0A4Z0MRX7_9BACT|nr:GNAT family N-acetyltransferase [Hymenobacter wooponensis]TGD82334.1 GNAT family N-acetyltransferase [Hymenobacter wooponensis]
MEHVSLRKASLCDVISLQQIGRQTFQETFAASNSEDNMRAYLEEGFSAAKLTAELQNPESTFYLAELNSTVIGYLKVNTGAAQTEQQSAASLEIERIYVLQAYHGKKVGQVLYEQAMQLATQAQVDFVWLGVWEQNAQAIRFYQKNGFDEFDKHVFQLGDDAQIDILMKRTLTSAA